MYKVLETFKDIDGTVYKVGDKYNNEDEKRIEILSTPKNKYKYAFIEKTLKSRARNKKESTLTVDE